jgi:hypothetical protein
VLTVENPAEEREHKWWEEEGDLMSLGGRGLKKAARMEAETEWKQAGTQGKPAERLCKQTHLSLSSRD